MHLYIYLLKGTIYIIYLQQVDLTTTTIQQILDIATYRFVFPGLLSTKTLHAFFFHLPEERNLYISWCESTQIYKEAMLIAEMIKHIGYYPNI